MFILFVGLKKSYGGSDATVDFEQKNIL